jgi:hypothetical protein
MASAKGAQEPTTLAFRLSHSRMVPARLASTSGSCAVVAKFTARRTMGLRMAAGEGVTEGEGEGVPPGALRVVEGVRVLVALGRLVLLAEGAGGLEGEREGVAPGLSVGVGVRVPVREGVPLTVALGVALGVGVGVAELDCDSPLDTAGVGVLEAVGVGVALAVVEGVPWGEREGERDSVGVREGLAPGDREEVGVRVCVGVGV